MRAPDDETPHDDRIRALERARLADGVATARPAGGFGTDGHPPADLARRPAGPLPPGLAAHVRGAEGEGTTVDPDAPSGADAPSSADPAPPPQDAAEDSGGRGADPGAKSPST